MKLRNKKIISDPVKRVNLLWLVLMALTVFSAYMSEQSSEGLSYVVIMAIVLGIKGRIIVDYFMELKEVNVILRSLMQAYFIIIPLMIIVVYLFPEQIATWTRLD